VGKRDSGPGGRDEPDEAAAREASLEDLERLASEQMPALSWQAGYP
jgi:hypothetical protein